MSDVASADGPQDPPSADGPPDGDSDAAGAATYYPEPFVSTSSRGYTNDGDWLPGSVKGQCNQNDRAMGLSVGSLAPFAPRALLCMHGLSPTQSGDTASTEDVYRLGLGDARGDSRSGDWDPGFTKVECQQGQSVTGVAQTTTGVVDGILCTYVPSIQANENDCHALVFNHTADLRRAPDDPADWDSAGYKNECAEGEIFKGLSRDLSSGQVHAILCCGVQPVRPAKNLSFQTGGPIRNLWIDVVFWGFGTDTASQNEMTDVKEYMKAVTHILTGDQAPPGVDPTIRYYGLWGAVPGDWIIDTNPVPVCDVPVCANALTEIAAAKSGAFGVAQTIYGASQNGPLPSALFRLAILVTKGVNWGDGVAAFHDTSGQPYAAVRADVNDTYRLLSREIMAAMTDPSVFSGWATNESPYGHHEGVDDACDIPDESSPVWILPATGDNISGISAFAYNPPSRSMAANTCQIFEPEQYAPITARLSSTKDVFFRTPGGHLNQMSWSVSGTSSGIIDLGAPSPPTVNVGNCKPSIVDLQGDTYIYVRGDDFTLWQLHKGAWTPLTGLFYGDPSAVVVNGNDVQVYVLGIDNQIAQWTASTSSWATIYKDGGISAPPRAFSKGNGVVDLFATGQDGHLEWILLSGGAQQPVVDLGLALGAPHHTPVAGAFFSNDRIDILSTTEVSVVHRTWQTSWLGDYDTRFELGNSPAGSPAFGARGDGIGILEAVVVDRENRMWHSTFTASTDTWTADPANPITGDAVGDAAIIVTPTMLDVYYRSTTGALMHMAQDLGSGAWTKEGAVTANGVVN